MCIHEMCITWVPAWWHIPSFGLIVLMISPCEVNELTMLVNSLVLCMYFRWDCVVWCRSLLALSVTDLNGCDDGLAAWLLLPCTVPTQVESSLISWNYWYINAQYSPIAIYTCAVSLFCKILIIREYVFFKTSSKDTSVSSFNMCFYWSITILTVNQFNNWWSSLCIMQVNN